MILYETIDFVVMVILQRFIAILLQLKRIQCKQHKLHIILQINLMKLLIIITSNHLTNISQIFHLGLYIYYLTYHIIITTVEKINNAHCSRKLFMYIP